MDGVTQVRLKTPIRKNIVFGYLNNMEPSNLVTTSIRFFKEWCQQKEEPGGLFPLR